MKINYKLSQLRASNKNENNFQPVERLIVI